MPATRKELNAHLREELRRRLQALIGESAAIKEIREQIQIVGDTEATVLIQGDSGTGKELVAHELHKHSKEKQPSIYQDKPRRKVRGIL